MSARVMGAVIAGGASTRFGSPKALAVLDGVRVVDRVIDALRAALADADVVAIANDTVLAEAIGLPHRADALHGIGALAGVHAALVHASETAHDGVLAVACDMPFLSTPLLRHMLTRTGDADLVVPESTGPRGIEPLCAYYGTACIAAIERAAARGDARMIGFHADVRVARVPLERVREYGDPDILFRNLNTPADLAAAQEILRGAAS